MKTRTKVIVVIGVILSILICLVVFSTLTLRAEYKYFNTINTGKLNNELYSIKDDFVNVFILEKNNKFLVIDSGNTKINIENGLKELGIDSSYISVLLLTHTDYDHVAQVELYKNAKVFISTDEENMINGNTNKKFFIHNKLNTNYSLLPNNGIQEIDNWKVQTILVPGHTAGSVCYVIDDKYLFTGDSISIINGKVKPFNDFFNKNTKQQIINIPNIAHLVGIELVLTAHYGISKNYSEIFSEWK